MSDAKKSRRNHRLTLLLLAGVAVLPLLAAYVLYLFWRPSSLTNYGELLPPTSIADAVAPQPDGSRFDFARFKGKWVMLMVDSGHATSTARESFTGCGKSGSLKVRTWSVSSVPG